MKKYIILSHIILLMFVMLPGIMTAQKEKSDEDKLTVVWTSDDPYVAERVALMYTHAAAKNNWFKEVTLIIWGPSAKLTSENLMIQKKLKEMEKDGVIIKACSACANAYHIADELRALGFEVDGMGVPLTNYLKDDTVKVLTF